MRDLFLQKVFSENVIMMNEENEEVYQELDDIGQTNEKANLIVFSRDWTVATILNQIEQGNIDLNPGFQRRNAWNDKKRSKLIESIMIGYPIPEIVLAEDKNKRNSFIVIDGKQRLLTIAGFKNPEAYQYWTKKNPKTTGLTSSYNLKSYEDISANQNYLRIFENSALRCTVISNYPSDESLYDIFYRLNSGSTPLSSQELRQALNKGPFSEYLIMVTDEDNVLRRVMNLKEPDKRLRDVEVLLRCMSFLRYSMDYKGNLLQFLDKTTRLFNEKWETEESDIRELEDRVMIIIDKLIRVFGSCQAVARKYKNGEQNTQFNRVILEVLVYYFDQIDDACLTDENNRKFVTAYISLFSQDLDFQATIDGSTKNMENYKIRYSRIQDIVNENYGLNLVSPFEYVERRIRK